MAAYIASYIHVLLAPCCALAHVTQLVGHPRQGPLPPAGRLLLRDAVASVRAAASPRELARDRLLTS